jgi:pyruvate,water dikinase
METVLDVNGAEALSEAIARVLGSISRPEIEAYAQASGPRARESLREGRLAILVQEMVPARAAGVAFSSDPLTGRSTVVIEAVPHTAADLVQGRVQPDRFLVDPRGKLIQEIRDPEGESTLPSEEITELANLVRDVAASLGSPQDVEWVWDGARIHLVQARPITTLQGKRIYSRKLVGDMSPGPIKHLVWSTNTLGMVEGVFGEIFTRVLGENDHDFRRILKRIRSRAYVDTTFVGDLLREVGLPRNLFEAIGREERVSMRIRPTPRMLRRLPRLALLVLAKSRVAGELDQVLEEQEAALDELGARSWSGVSAPVLLSEIEKLLAGHRKVQTCVVFGSMNMAIRVRLLKRFVARHAPDVDPSRLLLGLRGTKSLEPNRALREIARDTGLLTEEQRSALRTGQDRHIRDQLDRTREGSDLLKAVDAFLARHGYLSENGTNFAEPAWAEEPAPVWTTLARLIRDDSREVPDPSPMREAAVEEVLGRLGPLGRIRFNRRLDGAVRYLGYREALSLLMTRDTYELRRLCLALGRRLTESGVLTDPDDIFFLEFAELGDAVRSEGSPPDLRAVVEERREEFARDGEAVLPETILGEEIPLDLPGPGDAKVLNGIGASAGSLKGRARLVRRITDAPSDLSSRDILVVPFSDVGWTPLFANVGGIVAECGGMLSHTAIVAREYGLPAAVGVRGAMRLIQDGQVIALDGGSGRVLLDPDESQ